MIKIEVHQKHFGKSAYVCDSYTFTSVNNVLYFRFFVGTYGSTAEFDADAVDVVRVTEVDEDDRR